MITANKNCYLVENAKLDGCPSLPFQPNPFFFLFSKGYHKSLDPFLLGEKLSLGELVISLCLGGEDDHKNLEDSFFFFFTSAKIQF